MRNLVRFLLGNELREVANPSPTMTVLDYLRRVERRCGTKEGCAEGDCGACTVAIAEPDGNGGLSYKAVNACIQFLPALDGRQLLTVEDLGRPDALHPVQQALCDTHGSQCGFCTPGIVMSIFAAAKAGRKPSRPEWKRVLAGNLCRCTGYGPILAAAEGLDKSAQTDDFAASASETAAALAALDNGEILSLEASGDRWFAPKSLEDALGLLQRYPEARLVAGATDVGLWVTKQHRSLETIIWLGRVSELAAIRETPEEIVIGAGVTLEDAGACLVAAFPAMATLIGRFASRQIRNVATVGGNIANGSPIGDLAPAFIALDATLELCHAGGERTLPLEEFFIDYGRQDLDRGELVKAVRIPRLGADRHFGCYKISKRFEQDISAVMGAFRVEVRDGRVTDARFAFGGMAGTPARAPGAEAALIGHAFDEAGVAAAMSALQADFTPLTDMRASAAYRLAVARNLILKFFLQVTGIEEVSTLDEEVAS